MLKRLLFLIMLSVMLFVLANTVAHANSLKINPEIQTVQPIFQIQKNFPPPMPS